jgi:hypothetical protein
MSDGDPADAGADTFLLTVRGTPAPTSLDETRTVHNSTAGAPPSIAGARALGDLSHNVYSRAGEGADSEILFIDLWNSLSGLGRFFQDPQVQQAAGALFAERDGTVWAKGEGYGSFNLTVPSGREAKGVGLLRARVTSYDAAASAFSAYAAATVNKARTHGIVAHSVWTRVASPGEAPVIEVVGIDQWLDVDEMQAYYDLQLGFEHFGSAFAGAPDTSVWQQAPGEWAEW